MTALVSRSRRALLRQAAPSVFATTWVVVALSVSMLTVGYFVAGSTPSPRALLFATLIPAVLVPLFHLPQVIAHIRLKDMQRELEQLASFDSLTGLLNRRVFFSRADAILAATDASERPVGVLMADVDHFKAINDQHGHLFGDDAIRAVASTLVDAVADATQADSGQRLIARFGGEEFVVLIEGVGRERLLAIAESVRNDIAKYLPLHLAAPLTATISIGATVRDAGQDIDTVLRAADAALYDAKRAGRNCVRYGSVHEARGHDAATLVPEIPAGPVRARKRAADAA
jgi:diguanylate cyclase (GGDEF)-like protein